MGKDVQLRDTMTGMPEGMLLAVATIAQQAGEEIRRVLAGTLTVAHKPDASPVTNADHAAHALIAHALAELAPGVALISEENAEHPPVAGDFWCVDPLDGTRSLLEGVGEYTVNIALMRDYMPVLGVLYCPTDGVCYAGACGKGAWKRVHGGVWQPITVAQAHGGRKRAIVGARDAAGLGVRMRALLEEMQADAVLFMSSARKFGVLAEGAVDLYPRFMRTYEWDTAAGHALLLAAGGQMRRMDGSPFTYGKPEFENGPFVASAS